MNTALLAVLIIVVIAAATALAASLRRVSSLRDELEDSHRTTRRVEADKAAAEVVAWRLEASLDVLHAGLVVCDSDGSVVARNTAAARFLSARHGEALIAKTVNDLLERALMGETASASLELHTEPRRAFEMDAKPIMRHDEVLGVVGLVRDVTEQQRIDAVRRDFVTNVSHELKTPIGALSLLAESLVAEPSPDVVERLADRVLGEAQRVANTIDDLLTLSSIEDEAKPLDEMVEISEVVSACINRIAAAAEQQRVHIEESAAVNAGTVRGSRVQLESALFNLLDNAVKFSEPSGRVALSVGSDGETLKVVVSDEGPGIPTSEQDRIFERFYRVDRARSRHTGGTGLGLSIVRHAVLNHGGDVDVTSREGCGATFTMTLPLAAPGLSPTADERARAC